MPKTTPKRFTDEETARPYLEAIQWPEGPICPHCGTINRASAIKGGRKGLKFCNSCREQFTVTVGTVFECSKVPLNTWLYATHLLCSSKKGISSHQLARMLGVTYKTAWFMAHRIREAMAPAEGSEPPQGGFGKIVEADETYIGRADGPRGKRGQKAWGGMGHKMKIVSLVERGGNVRSKRVKDATKLAIKDIIRENVHPASVLHTDGSSLYTNTGLVRIACAVTPSPASNAVIIGTSIIPRFDVNMVRKPTSSAMSGRVLRLPVSMSKPLDPTKDPEFRGVIQHFLKTPPKPFTPKAKKKPSPAKAKAKKTKG